MVVLIAALAKELIHTFVLYQRSKGGPIDSKTFFDWYKSNVKNYNYLFAWRICFTFLLAFNLYTQSVRKNNHQHMIAARSAFAPLFYGRNHPRYREVHLRDMMDRVQCPDDIKKDIEEHETFSVSGANNKGQGADFIHEEVNRAVKALLPPGAVTANTWTKVCRKADQLSKMKAKCLNSSGIHSTSGNKAPQKHDHEETMFRREIRHSRILESPCEEVTMTSISGEDNLDYDLPNMLETLKSCYQQYKDDLKESGLFGSKRISKTLYITKADRERGENIENKTISEIKDEIQRLIKEAGLQNHEICKKLKANAKKADYLKLYSEVLEVAEEVVVLRMQEEEEDQAEAAPGI